MNGDLVGKTIAHYRVLSKLGQGGMGVVYTAEDSKLGRTIALKVLREDWVGDETRRQRFLREARAAAAITHANIATVHEVGEADDTVYIAMELIEGQSLRTILAARSLTMLEAVRIAKDVARGVARAHDKGIVHRDLKPDNVMVSEEGGVKVLDFGLAKSMVGGEHATLGESPEAKAKGSGKPDLPNVTETGQLMGTPAYMAPEQAMGEGVDLRADVFSFGVMLYEMVTGKRPFDAPNAVGLIVAVARDAPAPPSSRNAHVPPELERVILRCLEKRPVNRYASMRELLGDLERVETAQISVQSVAMAPTLDAQTASVGAVKLPSQRRKLALVGAAVAIVAAVFGASRFAKSPPPPTAIASPTTSSRPAPNAPTALTDLPPPRSSVPAAVGAYTAALAAYRAGNFEEFDLGMREALRLDPSCAAAELRVAFTKFLSVRGAVTDARGNLERASRARATLSDHDQILLDVLEPIINREPADSDEMERRLRAGVARFPLDAELLFLLANEERRHDLDKSLATYDRALAADPDFMTALRQKAQTLAMKSDFGGARSLLDDCLRRFPGATGCRNERIWLNQDEGRCADIEPDARQMIAADPESFRAYEALARAAVSLGRPPEAIAEALAQAWRRAPAEVRARDELLTNARLAALAGRFDDARDAAKKCEAAISADPAAAVHASVASLLVEIDVEVGDAKGAARTAQDFLRRQGAWSGAPDAVTARMLKVEQAGGVIDDAALRGERARFLEEWGKQNSRVRFERGVRWLLGYAALVESKADADEAMGAMPAFAPIPVGQRTAMNDEADGRARYFSGDYAGAAAALGRASRMCVAIDDPFRHVRAHALLGRALEARGDKDGACAAYRVVAARWGDAKPRSVSATQARERAKALGCGR